MASYLRHAAASLRFIYDLKALVHVRTHMSVWLVVKVFIVSDMLNF